MLHIQLLPSRLWLHQSDCTTGGTPPGDEEAGQADDEGEECEDEDDEGESESEEEEEEEEQEEAKQDEDMLERRCRIKACMLQQYACNHCGILVALCFEMPTMSHMPSICIHL